MQGIAEKNKYKLELKSKIRVSEEQRNKLKEYITLLENIMYKTSGFDKLIPHINSGSEFK